MLQQKEEKVSSFTLYWEKKERRNNCDMKNVGQVNLATQTDPKCYFRMKGCQIC